MADDYIRGYDEFERMMRLSYEYTNGKKIDGHIPRETIVAEFTKYPSEHRTRVMAMLDGYLRQENVPASAVRDVSRVQGLRRALGDRHSALRKLGR
jgi:hypothetical protein